MMNLELKPISDGTEFERFCCEIAKDVFGDFLASRYGRNGQKQSGIDVRATDVMGPYGRVVIQCKFNQVPDANAALAKAAEEFEKDCNAAKSKLVGSLDFDTYVYAGLWPADVHMDNQAKELAKNTGKAVHVWSKETLETYVRNHPRLQRLFSRGRLSHGVQLLDQEFWAQARQTDANALLYYAAQGMESGGQQWVGLTHGLDAPCKCVPALEKRLGELLPRSANLSQKVVAVVHGEGGSGKSTVLRRIALNQAEKPNQVCWWIEDLDQFTAHDAQSVGEKRGQKHLLFIEDWYRNVGADRAKEFFSWLGVQQNVLVLIGDRTTQGRAYMNHLYGRSPQAGQANHEALFALYAGENQQTLEFVLQKLVMLNLPGIDAVKRILINNPQLLAQAPLFMALYVLCHEAAQQSASLDLADGVQARFGQIIAKQLHELEHTDQTRGIGQALFVQAHVYTTPEGLWRNFSEETLLHTARFFAASGAPARHLEFWGKGSLPTSMAALVHRSAASPRGNYVRFNHDLIAEVGIGQGYSSEEATTSSALRPSLNPQVLNDQSTLLSLFNHLLEKQDAYGSLQLFCRLAHAKVFDAVQAHAHMLKIVHLHIEKRQSFNAVALLGTCQSPEDKRALARVVTSNLANLFVLAGSAPLFMLLVKSELAGIACSREILAQKEFWLLPFQIISTALKILGANDEGAKTAAREVLKQDKFWLLPPQLISTALNVLGANDALANAAALTILKAANTLPTFLVFASTKVLAETADPEAKAVLQEYLDDLYNKPASNKGEFRLRYDLLYLPLFFNDCFLRFFAKQAKGYRSNSKLVDIKNVYKILHCQYLYGEQNECVENITQRLCQNISRFCDRDVEHQWKTHQSELSLMHIGLAFEILQHDNWKASALYRLEQLVARYPDLGQAEQLKQLLLVLHGKAAIVRDLLR